MASCRWAALAAVLSASVLVPAAVAGVSSADGPPHEFVIVPENKTYELTFGPDSPVPHLATTLPAQGVLLRQYHGIGHVSFDNYIAIVGGQAPNPQTQTDCQWLTDFVSPTGGALDANGQVLGSGCVYPRTVRTVRTSSMPPGSRGRAT